MKKNLLALALLVGIAATADARERSIAEMQKAAISVLGNRTGVKGAPANAQALKVLKKAQQLTVLGTQDGGFAVIANDDAFSPVLGYSDTKFSDNHAPGFLWWMDTMNKALAQSLADGSVDNTVCRAAEYKESVPQLLTTTWGQDAPFNLLTPEYTDKSGNKVHYVTGCVATAMSMIMHYHRYPQHGMGESSYRFTPGDGTSAAMTLSANYEDTYYDWDNMLDSYDGVKYTDAQANAVATLMYHCGVSVKMKYTADGSGAYSTEACKAFRNYFRYNGWIKCYMRSYFPKDEFMNLIYREINDGCPVLFGGQSTSGGHEFIFDGYNEQGLVHVNWGWNGTDNGYYDIAQLHGYSSGQELVEVRDSTDKRFEGYYRSYWGTDKGVKIARSGSTGVTVKSDAIYNLDVDDFTGDICLMAMNQDNGEKQSIATIITTPKTTSNHGLAVNASADISSLRDGTYRLYLATFANGKGELKDKDYQPVRSPENISNSAIVEIEGGEISSLKTDRSGNWTAVGIDQITYNRPAYEDCTVRVYDTTGRMVYSSQKSLFNINDVPAKGVLVVKSGNTTQKVVKQ